MCDINTAHSSVLFTCRLFLFFILNLHTPLACMWDLSVVFGSHSLPLNAQCCYIYSHLPLLSFSCVWGVYLVVPISCLFLIPFLFYLFVFTPIPEAKGINHIVWVGRGLGRDSNLSLVYLFFFPLPPILHRPTFCLVDKMGGILFSVFCSLITPQR